jgi:subtilase family serine protease
MPIQMRNHLALHHYSKIRPIELFRATLGAHPFSWRVPDLLKSYGWPTGLTAGVQSQIAIVELGGGRLNADTKQFCSLYGVPIPNVADVSVDGTINSPGLSDADGEVALDIQVAAAWFGLATGEPANIFMYWSQDIASAVMKAADDGRDVCSISWGADESQWGNPALEQMEAALIYAAGKGMVVTVASGDNDADDGGGVTGVDSPASCPHAIACGGTNHFPNQVEKVWNNNLGNASGEGTGGGFSDYFQAQEWQTAQGQRAAPKGLGRMVSDVAAAADPNTGYEIVIAGQVEIIGGTSAVAPLYAGLIAASGRKLGWITPILWQHPECFVKVPLGNNGVYGGLVCCGLGRPRASMIAKLLAV